MDVVWFLIQFFTVRKKENEYGGDSQFKNKHRQKGQGQLKITANEIIVRIRNTLIK